MRLRSVVKKRRTRGRRLGVGACLAVTPAGVRRRSGGRPRPGRGQGRADRSRNGPFPPWMRTTSDFQTATFAFGYSGAVRRSSAPSPGSHPHQGGIRRRNLLRPHLENLSGAAETVQVDFDPSQVSYEQLVETSSRSTTPRFQPAAPASYRSVIFVSGPEQEQTARSVLQSAQKTADGPILRRSCRSGAGDFHLAESYHQKYILQTDRTLFEDLTAAYPNIWDFGEFHGGHARQLLPGRLRHERASAGRHRQAGAVGRLGRRCCSPCRTWRRLPAAVGGSLPARPTPTQESVTWLHRK